MSKRLMTQFEPLIAEAIEKHNQGEDISWEVGFGVHPAAGPCYFVGLFTPNPAALGEWINFVAVLGPAPKVVNSPTTDRAIADGIKELLDMRSKALQAPSPEAVGSNGGPTSPSGLHGLPGGP